MRQRDLRILSTVGILIAIVGVFMIMSGVSGKATPTDFNQEIQIRLRDFQEKALKAFCAELKDSNQPEVADFRKRAARYLK